MIELNVTLGKERVLRRHLYYRLSGRSPLLEAHATKMRIDPHQESVTAQLKKALGIKDKNGRR